MPTRPETLTRQCWPHVGTPTATGPISDAEMNAINESARWPVVFPIPMYDSACTGNCRQGRACDCAVDMDGDITPPRNAYDGWILAALFVACVVVWAVAFWAVAFWVAL